MDKLMYLLLSSQELEHIKVTLEGAKDELEHLSREVDWFATAIPERVDQCLEIVGRAK